MCLLLFSLPGQAHLPAVYGRDYLRTADVHSVEQGECAAQKSARGEPAAPGRLQGRLDELEKNAGPYASTLAEPLADLGRYHRDRGDYDEALRHFNRALHLVRVNDGLNSQAQLVLLEELAETYLQRGDLAALDRVQYQKFRVHGLGRDTGSDAALEATLDYLAWQRQAHDKGLDGNNMSRLLEAYLLNRRLLTALTNEGRVGEPRYRQLVLSQLGNLYLIMGAGLVETNGAAIVMSADIQPSQSGSESYVRQRIGRMQLGGLDEGRELLQSLIDSLDPGEKLARASMRLELGDWLQWNGDHQAAAEEYAAVVIGLEEQGETEILAQWLGEPRELPDIRIFRPFDTGAQQYLPAELAASFTVTGRGVVKDLQLSSPDGENSQDEVKFKRMLAGTHFRPRFYTGGPEEVQVERRVYRLVAEQAAGEPVVSECIAGLI